jgi:hypothetical protein
LPLKHVVELVKSYTNKNFVEVFRICKKLPLICQLALHRRLPAIEDSMIRVYNVAFSWKNTKFPVSQFLQLTLMNSRQSLVKYSDGGMVIIDADENIIFDRKNSEKTHKKGAVLRERLEYIDMALMDIDGERRLIGSSFGYKNAKSTVCVGDLDFDKKLRL